MLHLAHAPYYHNKYHVVNHVFLSRVPHFLLQTIDMTISNFSQSAVGAFNLEAKSKPKTAARELKSYKQAFTPITVRPSGCKFYMNIKENLIIVIIIIIYCIRGISISAQYYY